MEMHAKCQKVRAPAARVAPTQQTSSFTLYIVLFLYSICTVSVQYNYVQYLYSICTVSVQYLYSIYTVSVLYLIYTDVLTCEREGWGGSPRIFFT